MLIKYLLIGGFNTLLTIAIIFILMKLGVDLYVANATAYAVGILISFILNSLLTFKKTLKFTNLIRFLISCGVSYSLNVAVIYISLSIYPSGEYISQLLGMATYTLVGFFINKLWAIK